jgi:hypothetical protein
MNVDPRNFNEAIQISRLEATAQQQDLAATTQKTGA